MSTWLSGRTLPWLAMLAVTASSVAGPPAPRKARMQRVHTQTVTLNIGGESTGRHAGGCASEVSTHFDGDIGPGQYVAQGGFIEGEIAATSFVLPASAFPVRVDLMEFLFATSSTTVTTTTVYRIRVWEGVPGAGPPVFSIASDGDILPHLVIPPGTNGTNLQFLVDPGDTDQIILQDGGDQTVSIGIEIVEHHSPSVNQCLIPPDSARNAFPCTDTDGLQASSGNWIFVEDCGAFGCPPGWKRFSDLPSVCRPSGDWVQRLTWTPTECGVEGPCCVEGDCFLFDEATCRDLGGVFSGVGGLCGDVDCAATSPCCFSDTGGCVDLDPSTCQLAGGVSGSLGASCQETNCFPAGACCLPDGSCSDGLGPDECASQGGVFQGDGTSCGGITCPDPQGAACFPNGFCTQLTEVEAATAGADWKGPGTDCADADGDGVPDACAVPVPGDFNGDERVDGSDLGIFLVGWGKPGVTDLDQDGTTDGRDLGIMLISWTG